MNKAAEAVEVLLHVGRIDQQLFDNAGEAVECKVQRHCGVGTDHALDRRVRDVALMPEHDILQRGCHGGANDAREAGEVFRQHRIALVRHRRRTLLAFGEEFFGFQHFGALHVADFGSETLNRGGDNTKRREEHRVPVARDHLCRDRLDSETHGLGDMRFDARVDLREGADCAGNGAGRDFLACGNQALFRAGEFGIGISQLETERHRLGMDAVRAADGRRHLVFEGAGL